MSLRDRGREVQFSRALIIRSLSSGRLSVVVGQQWTGESLFCDCASVLVDGGIGVVKVDTLNGRDTFSVTIPDVHYWEKRTIEIQADLHEPHIKYEPHLALDSSKNPYTVFAKARLAVQLPGDVILREKEVKACEWVSLEDFAHGTRPSIRSYPGASLRKGSVLSYEFFPQSGRAYTLDFPFMAS